MMTVLLRIQNYELLINESNSFWAVLAHRTLIYIKNDHIFYTNCMENVVRF